MQINATLVKGKARVQFGANKVSEETLEFAFQVRKCPMILLSLNEKWCGLCRQCFKTKAWFPGSGGLLCCENPLSLQPKLAVCYFFKSSWSGVRGAACHQLDGQHRCYLFVLLFAFVVTHFNYKLFWRWRRSGHLALQMVVKV